MFVALLTSPFAIIAHAQSAEDIINHHIKAIGGGKALKAVTSTRFIGSIQGATSSSEFVWQMKAPGLFYEEIPTPGGRAVCAFNGKSSWCEDQTSGLRTLTGREPILYRAFAAYRNDHWQNWKKEKSKVELLGRNNLNGRDVFVIQLTTRTGIQRKITFDAGNYFAVKEEQERNGATEEISFSDYRPVEGIQEPFHILIHRGKDNFDVTIRNVNHNIVLDNSIFDFPKHNTASLPDIQALLHEVEDNQKKLDALKENFTYNRQDTEIEVDGKGHIKEKSERMYEVFYLDGDAVSKLIEKDGKPLSDADQKKEQERVEKHIREHDEHKKKREAEKQKRAAEGKKEDDDIGVIDFLRIMELTNPRRERFRGQDVIVFEFGPRPGYKPRKRAESLIQKLGGVIWIDERDKEVARLEARMLDSFKVGGGLVATIQQGSAMVFEQDRVKDEVWLPLYVEANLAGRYLLFAGFKINVIQRFSNYKKFNVESTQQVRPPA
ncbi:MAG: hypothetical protein HY046_07760 [Acidobacteria bacterium]|nr:hypothetical protein [Acidobacteriota bacterium]